MNTRILHARSDTGSAPRCFEIPLPEPGPNFLLAAQNAAIFNRKFDNDNVQQQICHSVFPSLYHGSSAEVSEVDSEEEEEGDCDECDDFDLQTSSELLSVVEESDEESVESVVAGEEKTVRTSTQRGRPAVFFNMDVFLENSSGTTKKRQLSFVSGPLDGPPLCDFFCPPEDRGLPTLSLKRGASVTSDAGWEEAQRSFSAFWKHHLPVAASAVTEQEANQVAEWARAVARQQEFLLYRPELNVLLDKERDGRPRPYLLIQDRACSAEQDGEVDIWKWSGAELRLRSRDGVLLSNQESWLDVTRLLKHMYADQRYALKDAEMGFAAQLLTRSCLSVDREASMVMTHLEEALSGNISDVYLHKLIKQERGLSMVVRARAKAKQCHIPGLLAGCHRSEHHCYY